MAERKYEDVIFLLIVGIQWYHLTFRTLTFRHSLKPELNIIYVLRSDYEKVFLFSSIFHWF